MSLLENVAVFFFLSFKLMVREFLIGFSLAGVATGLQSWPAAGPWTPRRGPSFSSWFSVSQSFTQRWAPTCKSKQKKQMNKKKKVLSSLRWRPETLEAGGRYSHGRQPLNCALSRGRADFFFKLLYSVWNSHIAEIPVFFK